MELTDPSIGSPNLSPVRDQDNIAILEESGKYDADYLEEQYSEPESSDSVKTYDYTPNQPILN